MSEVRAVDVNIMGREFKVSCTDDERDGLISAVTYLDRKMREIRDTGKVIGIERIAVMAALNMAHELLTTRSGGFDIGDLKRRMMSMQEQIDEAIAEQNKLF
ncbi:cell division protein ZapA [Methylovorus mays]|uniref:cell division protein ZapA n=1 Tax=Methylovorus mays TaxID=184077 RepID=UPI001E5A8B67|nr:cell division protein ZapA [Methylovorus mays]MCB5207143.1 cell division protein ZapA [Methylovorus mays]